MTVLHDEPVTQRLFGNHVTRRAAITQQLTMSNDRTLFIAAHNGGTPEPMVPFEYSGSTERVPIVIDNGEWTFTCVATVILPGY